MLRNLQDYAFEQATDLRDRLQKHYEDNGIPMALLDAFVDGGSVAGGASSTLSKKAPGQRPPPSQSSDSSRKLDKSPLASPSAPQATQSAVPGPFSRRSRGSDADQRRAMPPPSTTSTSRRLPKTGGSAQGRPSAPSDISGPSSNKARSDTSSTPSSASVSSGARRATQNGPAEDRGRGRGTIKGLDRSPSKPLGSDSESDRRSDRSPYRGTARPAQPRKPSQDRYSQYRDRSSDRRPNRADDAKPSLQAQRSYSPQDETRQPRQPRPQRGEMAGKRGSGGGGGGGQRDDKRDKEFVSGGSTSTSSAELSVKKVNMKPSPPPSRPAGSGMFSGALPPQPRPTATD